MAAVTSRQQGLPFVTLLFLKFAVLCLCLMLTLLLITSLVAPAVPIREAVAYTGFDTASNEYAITVLDLHRGAQMTLALRPYQEFYGWSTDGRFVFLSEADMNTEVYLWDGLTYTNISQHPRNDWRPSISRDGKVAFASERDGNMEIYVWDAGVLTNITQHPAADDYPQWSADGRLAFISTRDGVNDVIVWDGAAFHNISQTPNSEEMALVWAPDGRLSFASKASGDWQVMIWDGSSVTHAEHPAYPPNELAWSADGRMAYSDSQEVWVWDGQTAIQVTALNSALDYAPAWRADNTLTYVTWRSDGSYALVLWDGFTTATITTGSSVSSPVWIP